MRKVIVSKLSEYSELPVLIRLTESGQELYLVSSPKGGKHHISGLVGAETYEGYIEVAPIKTDHPDKRWDVRVSFCIPADAKDAELATTTKRSVKNERKVVSLDVDGSPNTEVGEAAKDAPITEVGGMAVDPFEQSQEILAAMPISTTPPAPGEEDMLEELARNIRATPYKDTVEVVTPQAEFSVSTRAPEPNEEELWADRANARISPPGKTRASRAR